MLERAEGGRDFRVCSICIEARGHSIGSESTNYSLQYDFGLGDDFLSEEVWGLPIGAEE